jgi:hypothetical protein
MATKQPTSVMGIVCVALAVLIFVANRMYRTSSRNGLDFFSIETLVQSWPYWMGAGLGLILMALWYAMRR